MNTVLNETAIPAVTFTVDEIHLDDRHGPLTFESVGELDGAGCPDHPRELRDRGIRHTYAGEHHAGEHMRRS